MKAAAMAPAYWLKNYSAKLDTKSQNQTDTDRHLVCFFSEVTWTLSDKNRQLLTHSFTADM